MSSFEPAPPDENRGINVSRVCAPPTEKERLPQRKRLPWGVFSLLLALSAPCMVFRTILVMPEWTPNDFVWFVGYFILFFAFTFGIIGLCVCQSHLQKILSVLGILFAILFCMPGVIGAIYMIIVFRAPLKIHFRRHFQFDGLCIYSVLPLSDCRF